MTVRPHPPRRAAATAVGLGLALAAAACDGAPARPPQSPPAVGATPAPIPTVQQLVDSSLRAFRAGLPAVERLDGGAASRDAVVRRFIAAAAARDSAALRRLLVTRAEFGWLYFPDAPLARPPYGIDPGFLWTQMGSNTDRDLPKAFAALPAGSRYVGHACAGGVSVEGRNRVHGGCAAIVARGARTDTLSVFGSILERDGTFKFLSYANRL